MKSSLVFTESDWFMRRKLLFVVAVLLLGASGSGFAFSPDDVYGKYDYPLIEIYFDAESEWIVIDKVGFSSEQGSYIVYQTGEALNMNKEYMRLLTFPVGRGTTASGMIYVYKNRELIKQVPYIEIYYESEELRNEFRQATKDEIEKILNAELPPPSS